MNVVDRLRCVTCLREVRYVGLAVIAPFVTTALAWSLRPRRVLSRFHRTAFAASVAYSGVMFVAVVSWLAIQILAEIGRP